MNRFWEFCRGNNYLVIRRMYQALVSFIHLSNVLPKSYTSKRLIKFLHASYARTPYLYISPSFARSWRSSFVAFLTHVQQASKEKGNFTKPQILSWFQGKILASNFRLRFRFDCFIQFTKQLSWVYPTDLIFCRGFMNDYIHRFRDTSTVRFMENTKWMKDTINHQAFLSF